MYDGSVVVVDKDTHGGANTAGGVSCNNGMLVGRVPKWELIKSYTAPSETTASTQIARDDNNQPFYLLAAYVVVHSQPKSASATAVDTEIVFRRSGNGVCSVVVPESVAGSHRYYSATCNVDGGIWTAQATAGQSSNAYATGTVVRGQKPTPSFASDANCIDRIDLGKMVTAGSTFAIYGVRGTLS